MNWTRRTQRREERCSLEGIAFLAEKRIKSLLLFWSVASAPTGGAGAGRYAASIRLGERQSPKRDSVMVGKADVLRGGGAFNIRNRFQPRGLRLCFGLQKRNNCSGIAEKFNVHCYKVVAPPPSLPPDLCLLDLHTRLRIISCRPFSSARPCAWPRGRARASAYWSAATRSRC